MTYTELYPKLIQDGLLVPISIPPIQPPYPRWYNENASCDYHSSNKGDFLEDCTTLKWKVSELIKRGELTFEDEDVPNINGNPLPNHGGPKVNVVESSQEMQVKRDVMDVCMPMDLVYEALVKVGQFKGGQRKTKGQEEGYYQYHKEHTGHSIQSCQEFLEVVQRLINEGEMEFHGETKEQTVSMLREEALGSLSIDMVEVEDQEMRNTGLPPFPHR